MLSNLFLKFDKKCQQLKCFKVYTIGDCYVVLGFDNAKYRNPTIEANNVVQMAFNMLEIIKVVRKEVEFETLNMRIGIHTGQIIGGITGSDIVRYDIYGTDVMLSNKMESNGEPGRIMVSQSTKDLLESAFESEYIFTIGNKVQDIQGYFIEKENTTENKILLENQPNLKIFLNKNSLEEYLMTPKNKINQIQKVKNDINDKMIVNKDDEDEDDDVDDDNNEDAQIQINIEKNKSKNKKQE